MSDGENSAEHVWAVDDYISHGPPAFDQYGMVVGVDADRRMLRVKVGVKDSDVAEVPFQDAKFIRHQPRKPDRRRRPGGKSFDRGDRVRVMGGAYAGFEGNIDEIFEERERLHITIHISGRPTPAEVAFSEVVKA